MNLEKHLKGNFFFSGCPLLASFFYHTWGLTCSKRPFIIIFYPSFISMLGFFFSWERYDFLPIDEYFCLSLAKIPSIPSYFGGIHILELRLYLWLSVLLFSMDHSLESRDWEVVRELLGEALLSYSFSSEYKGRNLCRVELIVSSF